MFQRVFLILATGNLPRMLGFYRDLLGAAVTYQFEHEGQVVYAGLELARPTWASATRRGWRTSRIRPAGSPCGWTWTTATGRSSTRANGVPVVTEPADQPWGERTAEVTDPTAIGSDLASGGPQPANGPGEQ